MSSFKNILDIKAPVAAAIIKGVNAEMPMSNNNTSKAKSTPAIGIESELNTSSNATGQ